MSASNRIQRQAALRAMASRIFPSDDLGPGAGEAGAAAYVLRSLSEERAPVAELVIGGIDTLDREARRHFGRAFAELPDVTQDHLLAQAEHGSIDGATMDMAAFFAVLV